MMVQAYACFYISMEMVNTKEDRGVAGLTGLILATKGAAWGLAAGIILYFLVGRQKEVKKEIAA
jgi:hypothetical protein